MSQHQPEASQASQLSAPELMSEIAFQKILLSSIDDTVQNREEAEAEVKAEIRSLEKQLRDSKRVVSTTSSTIITTSSNAHTNSTPQLPLASISKPITDNNNTAAMEDPFATPLQPQTASNPWLAGTASSTSSTPNSGDWVGDLTLSPSRLTLRTRKRSHSKHLDGGLMPLEDNKSRRTSPSPFHTGPATPTGSGDDDLTILDESFIQQQKEQEERMERERLDAEFARSLQNEFQSSSVNPPAMNPPAFPGLSAFDRITGGRPQISGFSTASTSNVFEQRFQSPARSATNWPSSSISPPMTFDSNSVEPKQISMTSGIKHEEQRNPFNTGGMGLSGPNFNGNSNGIKSEASSSKPMPSSYQDSSSSASDSEIEVIDSSAFRDNGRHPQTQQTQNPYASSNYSNLAELGSSRSVYGSNYAKPQRPSFSPEAHYTASAVMRDIEDAATNSSLQMAQFGNHPVPTWMQSPSRGSASQAYHHPRGRTLPSTYPSLKQGMAHINGTLNYPVNQQGVGAGAGSYVYPSEIPSYNNGASISGGSFNQGAAFGNGGMNGPDFGYTLDGAGNDIGNGFNLNHPDPSRGFHGMLGSALNETPLAEVIRQTGAYFDEMTDVFGMPYGQRLAEQAEYIMNDPRKTTQEIKELLENIRPDVDLPAEDREGTPDGLKYPLYEHQKLALTWLKSMEAGTNKGGILADDMGLGKTISALALILSRPADDCARKTTLIVGPVALVRQWEREIRIKIKRSHRLSTHMAHGSGRKLSWDELRNYDVVLTTYGTLGAEFGRLEKRLKELKDADEEVDEAPMRREFPLLGPKSLFYRVILDEAQCIKNKNTKSARAACHLRATTRFCLTGTPMMNNIGELYSLIHFLQIKPYNEHTRFQVDFGMLTKGDQSKRDVQGAMRKLQAVLKAILLRRTKTSLIDGKPIINLPPKTEEIQHVVFSEDEQAYYTALETKTQLQFNKYMKAGTVGKNYSNILVLLLRLRQCCCHPHLITDFEEAPAGAEVSPESMLELAKTLAPDVIARLVVAGAFECPVCYDAVDNPCIVIPCGHDTCSECLAKISDQAVQQNVQDGNEGAASSKCPTCRGKVDMKKIIDYATFKQVHMAAVGAEADIDDDETASENSDKSYSSDNNTEPESDEDEDGNLKDFIVPNDNVEEADDEDDEEEDGLSDKLRKRKSKMARKQKEEKKRQRAKKGKAKEEPSHFSISMMKKEATRSAEGRRHYMRYLKKNWQPSAKVDKCVDLLRTFVQEDEKTIIFSQFVSLLDLLSIPIEREGWKCERYDGSMSSDARNDAIVRFTDQPDRKIMLISLKAGNAGLNLVAASRVIILDPFWNPYIEMQAIDRAYRIGQQKSVQVHRILIEKTVEDRIIELQQRKKKFVDAALDEGASKSLGRLDERQLAFLFGVGGPA